MGFCFFNNAAIAARHAQRRHGAERVAIVDWDVHHGNGTQDIFWDDPSVLFCSTHQMPLYPGSGAKTETGAHDTIVNAPLSPNVGSDHFREAFKSRVLPALNDFRPDLIIISAGFDAHHRDPLGADQSGRRGFRLGDRAAARSGGQKCLQPGRQPSGRRL
jgi:acetoin utilization deacetylase AcuC-like enzyme